MLLSSLKDLLTLINEYENAKIFEMVKSIKIRGNVDALFFLKLKRFFTIAEITRSRFWLKPTSEQLSMLLWQNLSKREGRSTVSQIIPQLEGQK